jgi:biopolymer transport protein ExbD
MIQFNCQVCEKKLKVQLKYAGRSIRCPKCGAAMRVPVPQKPTESAATTVAADFVRRSKGDDELDMTPMIDCVFLLLIFFLVTSSFALQKAMEIPPPETESPTAQDIQVDPNEDDTVIIRITKDNTVWVDDAEAPSQQDVIAQLRTSMEGKGTGSKGAASLIVMASPDSHLEKIVMCLDAGVAVGMESMSLKPLPEDQDN